MDPSLLFDFYTVFYFIIQSQASFVKKKQSLPLLFISASKFLKRKGKKQRKIVIFPLLAKKMLTVR
jgi:hypothetical protein